jgi:HK97 family phage major capsid protein
MAMTIDDYRARQKDIKARQQELDGEYAGEALPEDARAEFVALKEEYKANETLIEELEFRMAELEVAAEDPKAQERGASFNVRAKKSNRDIYDLSEIRHESRSEEHMVELLRDNALRAVETTRFVLPNLPGQSAERSQGKIQEMIDGDSTGEISRRVLQTGSSTYKRAFGKVLSGRNLNPEEERAMTTVTTGGGYAIPFSLDPTFLHVSNYSVNPYRAICKVVNITGSNTWQGVTTTGVTASRTTEAGTASDNAPSFLQPQGTVSRVQCFVPYSFEVDGDIAGLEGELTSLFQEAKDDEEATAFTTGTGTAPAPVGILGVQGLGTAAPPKVLTAGTAAFAVADIDTAQITLAPRWRSRATWVANLGFYQRVRRFYAAGGETLQPAGGPGNQAGFQTGAPGGTNIGYGLLGRPAYECSAINTTNVLTTGTKLGIFGDFSKFTLVDRVGMNLEVIPVLMTNSLPTGNRGILAWWRNTSVLTAPTAFVYIQTL